MKLYKKLILCNFNKHEWEIIGTLFDRLKIYKYTPIVLQCDNCLKIKCTQYNDIIFKNFYEFTIFSKHFTYIFIKYGDHIK